MGTIGASILLLSLMAAQDKPAPKFSIGKETTYVTGPLDKDGCIDFETALNERLGKGITPEKNANVLIWKALGPTPGSDGKPADYFKLLGIDEPPKNGDYFIRLKEFLKSRFNIEDDEYEAIVNQTSLAGERPWSAKDYPHLVAWLKANEKPLALAIEASRRPEYFNPVVSREPDGKRGLVLGSMLPSVQSSRGFAFALTVRAMLRVAEGKSDEAWQDLLACHRLGRLIGRGASLIEALAGIGIDGAAYDWIGHEADLAYLVHAKLSSEQIKLRLKDLENLPPLPNMADKVELGNRLEFLDSMQFIVRGIAKGSLKEFGAVKEKDLTAEQRQMLEMLDWTATMQSANQWYDRMVATMRIADRAQREKEFDRLDKDFEVMKKEGVHPASVEEFKKLIEGDKPPYKKLGDALTKSIGNVCINMLRPGVRKVQNVQDRTEQSHRNLRIAFALAAYRADHGKYPARLQELTPTYLPSIPNDIFSGKPLVYRLTEDGYLLYSVGVNGQDDGGRNPGDKPPGDDLAVRMPLPELKPAK